MKRKPSVKVLTLYSTFANLKEARAIIASLLDAKLVACANILGAVESHYVWQGKREKSREIAVIFKTTTARAKAATRMIVEQHSYDCPCVVEYKIDGAFAGYLDWVAASVN